MRLAHEDFDLVIYNAGVDPHEDCWIGGLDGISHATLQARDRIVFNWCKTNNFPVAFCLAGGYTNKILSEKRLVQLHRSTIKAASSISKF